MYTLIYHSKIPSDLKKISPPWLQKIQIIIKTKIAKNPEIFGTPLRTSLSGSRKLRVGDYRIIYKIKDKSALIDAIGHRKDIYQIAERRISGK